MRRRHHRACPYQQQRPFRLEPEESEKKKSAFILASLHPYLFYLNGLFSQFVLSIFQPKASDCIGNETHGGKVCPVGDPDCCRVGVGAVYDDSVEDLMTDAKLA